MPDFLDAFAELVCQWKLFKDGIGCLSKAKKSTDKPQRWTDFGCFIGKVITAMGTN